MNKQVVTQVEKAFDALLEQILDKHLKPDQLIRQDALAAQIGVSKIPLREALARLEASGLVSQQPHRGFVVREILSDEAQDIFKLRMLIEPKATVLGSLNAADEDRAAAETALAAIDESLEAGGSGAGKLNREFHLALVRPSGRAVTTQLVEQLLTLAEAYVRIHVLPEHRPARATDEHHHLLALWLARDEEALSKAASEHIDRTLGDLLKLKAYKR